MASKIKFDGGAIYLLLMRSSIKERIRIINELKYIVEQFDEWGQR